MNKRERFIKTINREIPDRPPLFVSLTPQVTEKLAAHIGFPFEEPLDSMLSTRASHMDLLAELGVDAVGITVCAPENKPTVTREDGLIENEWGMIFKNKGLYNEFYEYPLAHAHSADDIANYTFPDPFAPGRWDSAENTISKYGEKLIALGADVLSCGDDFGIQESLMLDTDTWRKYIKPRIKTRK